MDETIADRIYARHAYWHDEIVWNRRFVDVVSIAAQRPPDAGSDAFPRRRWTINPKPQLTSTPTASATWAKPSRASSASQFALDAGNQTGAFIDQRGIKLHQRGAGADLGIGIGARGNAAHADQRDGIAQPLAHLAQDFGGGREQRRAGKAARSRAHERL